MTPRSRSIATTMLLAALAGAYVLSQQAWGRPGPPRPAHVERSAAPVKPAPSAHDVLARAGDLGLSADQRDALGRLDRTWREESTGLEFAVRDATRRFSDWMADAQTRGRASMNDIQRESEDVRALSASLRERRRLHAEAVAHVLTPAQRDTLGLTTSAETRGGNR